MSHLFVTQGDVTRTQCDAWILPTEAALGVTEAWHVALKARNIRFSGAALDHLPPDGWGDAGTRAFVIADARAEEPAVIAVNTGGAPGSELAWYVAGVKDALRVAESVGAKRVCMPAVGLGAGGQRAAKGGVLEHVLPALAESVRVRAVDVVFVAREPTVFSAAQRIRRGDPMLYWPGQESQLAERLAAYARASRLVLFLGAGLGREVGLPGWDELLAELAENWWKPQGVCRASSSRSRTDSGGARRFGDHARADRPPLGRPLDFLASSRASGLPARQRGGDHKLR